MEARESQRCVLEFPHEAGNCSSAIHRHLVKAHRAHVVDASTVRRWDRRFGSRDRDVDGKARSAFGKHTTTTPEDEARLSTDGGERRFADLD